MAFLPEYPGLRPALPAVTIVKAGLALPMSFALGISSLRSSNFVRCLEVLRSSAPAEQTILSDYSLSHKSSVQRSSSNPSLQEYGHGKC